MYIVWQPDFFLLTTYHEHFPTLITMIVSSLYAIVLNSVFHCVVVPEFTLLLFLAYFHQLLLNAHILKSLGFCFCQHYTSVYRRNF